jgi:hypothetical protein
MLAMTSVLLKSMMCLVTAECLATPDHLFSSTVSLMCSKILVEM